jgi:predicted nucleotidyltransferase
MYTTKELLANIIPLLSKYPVRKVALFGSYVKKNKARISILTYCRNFPTGERNNLYLQMVSA